MGMNRHDAYYEPEDNDYDDRLQEAEAEAWRNIQKGKEWDYQTSHAVAEALSELDVDQGKALQDVIDTGDYEKIGRKIMMLSMEYQEKFALNQAMDWEL